MQELTVFVKKIRKCTNVSFWRVKRSGLEIGSRFNVIKTKYFDFLFWNKFCCLETDLNFRKGFFKPELCNKKKRTFFFLLRKILGFTDFPWFWIWQPNWKIHIHVPLSLLTLMSHLQLLKKAMHHGCYSTSLLSLCKNGVAKMELCPCPNAQWHPGYMWPRVTQWPWTWRCLPTPQLPLSPDAPGLVPCQALYPYHSFI